jgi:hypothetical protein
LIISGTCTLVTCRASGLAMEWYERGDLGSERWE